jgi:hypothetical protein
VIVGPTSFLHTAPSLASDLLFFLSWFPKAPSKLLKNSMILEELIFFVVPYQNSTIFPSSFELHFSSF